MNEFEYIKYFAGLLAIVNPIGSVPIFISLTRQQTLTERSRTALIAAMTVSIVLTVTLMTGERILEFFGIGLPSFRVGGGILVLLIAISMLHAKVSPARQTEEEAQDASEKETVAVVPLGIPLLSGPGAISTVIVYAGRGDGMSHYSLIEVEILLVALIVWMSFRAAPYIAGMLGRTGINVITRLMGLIMAAIAVEIMANGLRALFPGLA
ncbi:MAG: YchE family NAAT transporter [Thiohalomonadaceae bacterium]